MAGRDTNIGAKRARETRSQLELPAGEPVTCVLTAVEGPLGLPVVIASLPPGIAGCCWRDGARVVLWVNGTHAAVRQRFTIAHELGHVCCRHDGAVPVETFETLGGRSTDSREVQANAFAAEFLAPADGVEAMMGGQPTLDDVVLISARFGISTIAALYRLNSLGLTKHYEEMKASINAGDHGAVWDRLAPEPVEDLIGAIGPASLPRVSPSLAGSVLAAVTRGSVSIDEAANAAGCDPGSLASGAGSIGI